MDVDAIRRVAAILRLGIHDQAPPDRRTARPRTTDRQIGAGDGRRRACREVGAHDLLNGAITFPPLGQLGQRCRHAGARLRSRAAANA